MGWRLEFLDAEAFVRVAEAKRFCLLSKPVEREVGQFGHHGHQRLFGQKPFQPIAATSPGVVVVDDDEADVAALYSDWRAIGSDLEYAINLYERSGSGAIATAKQST